MRKNLLPAALILSALAVRSSAVSQQIYSLETKNLRLIYYSKAHEFVVPHLARCFTNSLRFHEKLFDYTPTEKISLILQDFGDYGNGGASALPKNGIMVGISPFHYAFETNPANERMNALMNHELVHIAALDKSSSSDRFWQAVFFGKVIPVKENPITTLYGYLTTPRRYTPRWYHEGIASFIETWMAGGVGRALGNYDEMVFRTMVKDSAYIYDVVGLESEGTTIDFQLKANSYLYGTRFVSYLADQYGAEKLIAWYARTDDSNRYFSSQFEKVYAVPLHDEWLRWIEWERGWQRENLDVIRQHTITEHRPISPRALGSVSRAFYDPALDKIFAAINYPGQVSHIASIDFKTGRSTPLYDVKGAALYYVSSTAYDASTGNFFYTTDNNKWRDLNVLDVRTGISTLLAVDIRTGDLTFNRNDKSLWGVRHLNGYSSIVRIAPPYHAWKQVYLLPYGKDLFDIDLSPDGSILIGALAEIDGTQRLIKYDVEKLLQGDTTHEVLFDFDVSAPATFTFTDDGKFAYGSTYYTGVSNIVRYDFENKNVEWLTNTETGYFRPVPLSADSLIAFYYTGQGLVPVMVSSRVYDDVAAINFLGNEVVEHQPVVKSWKLDPPSPRFINIDSLTIYEGDYTPLNNMTTMSVYPIVEGYKEFPAYGLRLNVADYILLNELNLTASYTPNGILPENERLHATMNFHYWRWNFKATYNAADFYDLVGPTKVSRKGYSLSVQYKEFLVFDEPKTMDYSVSLTQYGGLERLPEFQNIATSFDNFLSLNGRMTYQFLWRSLGAVEEEKGIHWEALSLNNYVNGTLFSRVLTNLDYGFLLPLDHSSIWLRSSAGYSFGDRLEPLANFYFGGFGNNWVDYQEFRRYRDFYSFPGVELNAIGGTNYGKLLVEWVLPPLRFRRFGALPLYSNWAQLALFSSAITTNVDDSQFRRTIANLGAQIDFKLVVFSTLESTFSIGYARAFEKHRASTDEFMVSLKLLK